MPTSCGCKHCCQMLFSCNSRDLHPAGRCTDYFIHGRRGGLGLPSSHRPIARGPSLMHIPAARNHPCTTQVQSVLAQATNECTTALESGGGTWERQSAVRSVSGLSPDDTEPPHEKNPPLSTSVPNAHIKGSASFDWSRRRSLPQVCNSAFCIHRDRPSSLRPPSLIMALRHRRTCLRGIVRTPLAARPTRNYQKFHALSLGTLAVFIVASMDHSMRTTMFPVTRAFQVQQYEHQLQQAFRLKWPSSSFADDANGAPMELADAPQQRTWSFARRNRRNKVSGSWWSRVPPCKFTCA